ncbi:MAG: hypothetical protein ACXWX9_11530, partial [Actinomycetota bacterium]
VERLRDLRETPRDAHVLSLAAADPAQPYGAALPWPANAGRPARAAGAYVVLADGVPAAYLERGGRTLLTFSDGAGSDWPDAIASLVKDGRIRRIEITRIDGEPVSGSPFADRLRAAGLADGYRGLTLRS